MRHLTFLLLMFTGLVRLQAQNVSVPLGADGLVARAPSGQNCSFRADPDAFLRHESRARRVVHDTMVALDRAPTAKIAAAVDPAALLAAITHKKFIDDEIFGKMAAAGIAPAPLSTDEEFFRRVTLDLTGRIPSSGDIRAF